jgi:Tfp pilus assembly protein PilX
MLPSNRENQHGSAMIVVLPFLLILNVLAWSVLHMTNMEIRVTKEMQQTSLV